MNDLSNPAASAAGAQSHPFPLFFSTSLAQGTAEKGGRKERTKLCEPLDRRRKLESTLLLTLGEREEEEEEEREKLSWSLAAAFGGEEGKGKEEEEEEVEAPLNGFGKWANYYFPLLFPFLLPSCF